MEMPPWVEVLRFYMQRERFTVDQLAKASGVDRQTLFHWLKGRVNRPRVWLRLLLVAAALKLDDTDTSRLQQAAQHPALDDIRPLLVERLAQPTSLGKFERRLTASPLGAAAAGAAASRKACIHGSHVRLFRGSPPAPPRT